MHGEVVKDAELGEKFKQKFALRVAQNLMKLQLQYLHFQKILKGVCFWSTRRHFASD